MPSKILIVEDETSLWDLYRKALKNHKPSFVSDGKQAIDELKKEECSLLILDWMLPGNVKGPQLLTYARSRSGLYSLPVILVTGHREPEILRECYEAHANSFFSKPLDIVRLREKVDSLVGQKAGKTGNSGRILLIDDDEEMGGLVAAGLKQNGYSIFHKTCVNSGIKEALGGGHDAILLDWNFKNSKEGGEFVLTQLRSRPELAATPVIVLTASRNQKVLSECLHQGADDFLFKPFKMTELEARLFAALRKSALRAEKTEGRLSIGIVSLDIRAHALHLSGIVSVELRPQEAELLKHLMRKPGRVFSPEEMVHLLWDDPKNALAFEVYSHRLRTHIGNIRKRLPKGFEDLVLTIPKAGYSFNVEMAQNPRKR